MEDNARYKKRVKIKIWRRRIIAIIVLALVTAIVALVLNSCPSTNGGHTSTTSNSSTGQVSSNQNSVQTATIASTGDLLMHAKVFGGGYDQNSGTYNFDHMFDKVKDYYSKYDLMVMNLEVTLGGSEAGSYKGYPDFNSPDAIIDSIKKAGIDSVLFANNHAYDTGKSGFSRTMRVLKEKGVEFYGTRQNESTKKYTVKEINGIKIGIACYTYATLSVDGNITLNGHTMAADVSGLVNTFRYDNLSAFYREIREIYSQMKADKVDSTVIYVHWGNEYEYSANSYQKNMAQEISNTGFDVIIGGHPHVIQPMTTLTGTSGNKTVCLYSMGNSLSNQRIAEMEDKSGHTEDGLIFSLTFRKENGVTKLNEVDIIPTWVDLQMNNGKRCYRVIPLDTTLSDWSNFGVDISLAKASYNRTMKIVGGGLNEWRTKKGLPTRQTTIN